VKKLLSLSIAAATLAATQSVLAEKNSNPEHMLVTATRTEQSIDSTLAPVSVITSADIERLQAKDLVQILRQAPGVDVAQAGGQGSNASLFLRGSNSQHTLFLIDGQRFASATLGTANFQFINPEQIERIEIVRGPRASLYGADAVGGVVQIFTKKGNYGQETYIKTGLGKHSTTQLAAGTSDKVNNFRYAVNAAFYDTQGIDHIIRSTDTSAASKDDDSYRNKSININLGYDFSEKTKLDLSYLYNNAENEYDRNGLQPYSETYLQVIGASFSSQLSDTWFTTVTLGSQIDDSDNFDDLTRSRTDNFRTNRDSASWQNDFSINNDLILTLGFDYYDEEVESSSVYEDLSGNAATERDNKGYFGQVQYTIGSFDAQLALREDDNEVYDNQTTATAAFGYNINDQYRVIASYGEGFKAPSFNDLFFPLTDFGFGFVYVGNQNLKPEESENFELEVRGDLEQFQWSLSLYKNEVENLIEWLDPVVDFTTFTNITPGQPQNVSTAEITGAELTASTELAGWRINSSFNYTDPENEDTGKILTNRSKRTFKLNADRQYGSWSMGASWRVYSGKYADSDNTVQTGGYGLVDLRAGYQFNPELKVQVKIDNIFDKDFENNASTFARYNTYGLNWFVTLTYKM